jgi:hypothetical protein
MALRIALVGKSILLLLFGAGLIGLAFYVVMGGLPWSPVTWLNLAVCFLVFAIIFSSAFLIDGDVTQFDRAIPRLGILWIARGVYAVLAVGGMLIVGAVGATFLSALFLQLGALFILFIFFGLASSASHRHQMVTAHETKVTGALDSIRNSFLVLQGDFSALGPQFGESRDLFARSQADARYLTAASGDQAARLEEQLSVELECLKGLLKDCRSVTNPLGAGSLQECLLRIQELLRLRKECREV